MRNTEEIKCRICGIEREKDKNFHVKDRLCNRHWQQIKRHGKPQDFNVMMPVSKEPMSDSCAVCGDKNSSKYYRWNKSGNYQGKTLCNKHYLQMIRHGNIIDTAQSTHIGRHKWTPVEDLKLENLYKIGMSLEDIANKMNMRYAMINSRSSYLKLGDKYMRHNNTKFKAEYQNYEWCYDRYITQGKSHREMAEECGASLRVIQKWCSEIHRLNSWTYRKFKELTPIQYQIIMFGTLGDGHIDKREDQPMYIESHAEDEKEYVFWKYSKLKDLCNFEPKRYEASYSNFGTEKIYLCQPYYRFETRIINQLKEIRSMKRINKIEQLNDFGLSLHVLDDGSRRDLWDLCLAEYSQEEIDKYIDICKSRFNLNCHQKKDKRYITFDSKSSRKLDEIIMSNLPNDLDVIKKKITENNNIRKESSSIYVILNNTKTGLSSYCKSNNFPYVKIRDFLRENEISEITDTGLSEILSEVLSNEI